MPKIDMDGNLTGSLADISRRFRARKVTPRQAAELIEQAIAKSPVQDYRQLMRHANDCAAWIYQNEALCTCGVGDG